MITNNLSSKKSPGKDEACPQKIMVFQQNGSGESKIKGVRNYGGDLFIIDVFSIDIPLQPVIDNTREYLPSNFEADLVLDFLIHPDISCDLANICKEKKIPVIASGKKINIKWSYTPPT